MEDTKRNNIQQAPLSDILAACKRSTTKVPHHKNGDRFIKGPVPWDWIVKAANLSAGSLKVSLALWQLAGMKKSGTVKLSNGILKELGVSRKTKYRALRRLENAGLISVSKASGSSPEIRIN